MMVATHWTPLTSSAAYNGPSMPPVLKALTPALERSLIKECLSREIIGSWTMPETRICLQDGATHVLKRVTCEDLRCKEADCIDTTPLLPHTHFCKHALRCGLHDREEENPDHEHWHLRFCSKTACEMPTCRKGIAIARTSWGVFRRLHTKPRPFNLLF